MIGVNIVEVIEQTQIRLQTDTQKDRQAGRRMSWNQYILPTNMLSRGYNDVVIWHWTVLITLIYKWKFPHCSAGSVQLFFWPHSTGDIIGVTQCSEVQAHLTCALRPEQSGSHIADNIFKCISILIKISLKFIPVGSNDSMSSMFQTMAWHWRGWQAISLTHKYPMMPKYITRPQWVNWSTFHLFSKKHIWMEHKKSWSWLAFAIAGWGMRLIQILKEMKNIYILVAQCKTAVTPLLMHWSYCSLARNHWYISYQQLFVTIYITKWWMNSEPDYKHATQHVYTK